MIIYYLFNPILFFSKMFLSHPQTLNLNSVIQASHAYRTSTLEVPAHLKSFTALPANQYPFFNKYPTLVVDFQIQERERILLSEVELERAKRYHDELNKMNEKLKNEHELWITKHKAMLDAEEIRKKESWERERRVIEEKIALQNKTREHQINHIELLHANTKKFYDEMELLKEREYAKLREDLERKMLKEQLVLNELAEEQKFKKVQSDLESKYTEAQFKKELDKQIINVKNEIELASKHSELEIQKKLDSITHGAKERQLKQMVRYIL